SKVPRETRLCPLLHTRLKGLRRSEIPADPQLRRGAISSVISSSARPWTEGSLTSLSSATAFTAATRSAARTDVLGLTRQSGALGRLRPPPLVDSSMRRVRVGVVEDVERALVPADVEREFRRRRRRRRAAGCRTAARRCDVDAVRGA